VSSGTWSATRQPVWRYSSTPAEQQEADNAMARLERLHGAHPAVELRLRLGNRAQPVSLMQADAVDLSVMGRLPSGIGPTAPSPSRFIRAASRPPPAGRSRCPPSRGCR
jgi:hypothetical protein